MAYPGTEPVARVSTYFVNAQYYSGNLLPYDYLQYMRGASIDSFSHAGTTPVFY